MLDFIREIAQTIRNNKLRTALTGFAVAWGIFILILLLGLARGTMNSFNQTMDEDARNQIRVYSGRTSIPYKGYKDGRNITLNVDDHKKILASDRQSITEVNSTAYLSSVTISTSHDYVSDGLSSYNPKSSIASRELLYGRRINGSDEKEKRKVMYLPSRYAKVLFNDQSQAVGKYVNAMGLTWQVVGVYKSDWDDIYIPFSTAMMLKGNDGKLYNLTVSFKDIETEEEGTLLEENVRKTLAQAHEFSPEDKSAVWIWNAFTGYLDTRRGLNILEIAIWVMGLCTMLSGIVGVSNIMFVSVRERVHEFGIRRAIGAKPRSILMQVVLESVAITTLFGYIGVFFGMVILQVAAAMIPDDFGIVNPTVDLSMALKVTVALVVVGALAGVFPAIRATKIRPVEALGEE